MIWHIYSHLYWSSRDGGRDLPSSGKAAPTMGQVPCEFQADWPTFIFQLVAPDEIWHIFSGQCCFKGVLGMDLLSSGDVTLTMGQVSCEFWTDWPTFIFQLAAPDMIWHIYSGQCCLMGDGGIHLPSSGEVLLHLEKVLCKSPGECNIPPENGRSIPSTLLTVNVPNHVRSCQLKNEGWPICSKLTGNLCHGRGCLPWRWQVPTTISWGAVQVRVNVPNHVRSHQLKNKGWLFSSKLTGHLLHGRDWFTWR